MPSLFAFLVLFLGLSLSSQASNHVPTTDGPVLGKALILDGRTVWQFLGIPFAKPPVGNLRFLPPQPLQGKRSKPLFADKAPKGCLQTPVSLMSWPQLLKPKHGEDCLYLDMWTTTLDPKAKKAVMVWIHGGGFTTGEGLPLYNGTALSSMGDVVVVTIQYRLNLMGFARLDKSLVPGNNGLLDQQMALRWVYDNIENFGGDPGRITIFGESAGSASVSFHLTNRESGRYFKRAILQSGSLGNPWAYNPNSQAIEKLNRRIAAKYLNCTEKRVTKLLECLQSKSEAEMLNAIVKSSAAYPTGGIHVPLPDGRFIRRSPAEIMSSGEILKKDVIIGVNDQEGGLFTAYGLLQYAAMAKSGGFDLSDFANETVVNQTMGVMVKYFPAYPSKTSPVALSMIQLRSFSHVNPNSGELNAIRLAESLGEYYIYCGVNTFADAIHKVHNKVYFYELAHKLKQPMVSAIPKSQKWMKTVHLDDVAYVFALPIVLPHLRETTGEEMKLTRMIIADFTTFAKTGSPQNPEWKPFTLEKKEYFRYATKSRFRSGGVKRNECVFWDKVLPMVMKC